MNLKPGYTVYKDWDMNKSLSLAGEAYKQNPLPLYTLQEGNTLYALKDYEKAFEKYLSLTGTNMRSANLFLYAAQCKRMAGADTLQILALQDSAVACFSKPYLKDAAPALLERSNTLLALGRYRDAILDLNEYEHLMGDELTAYFYYRREQAEMQCRMFQQAINDINKAIELDPQNVNYWVEKGGVCLRVNQTAEAVQALEKAISIDSQNAPAYRMLGYIQVQQKQTEKGIANLKKAKELGDEVAIGLLEKYSK